jgi:hypothetical protein
MVNYFNRLEPLAKLEKASLDLEIEAKVFSSKKTLASIRFFSKIA